MIHPLCRSLCLALLFALCQWLAPATLAPLRSAWASVPGVTCKATVTNLSFGNVNPTSNNNPWANGNTNLNTTGYLTYYCQNTGTTAQNVSICFSFGSPQGSNPRAMSGPYNTTLQYQLYQDPSNQIPWGTAYNSSWGSAQAISTTIPASGTSAPATIPIYATIQPSQNPYNLYISTYSSTYNGGGQDTRMDVNAAGVNCSQPYSGGGTISGFSVSANIQNTCQVLTNPLTFPNTPSGTANTITAQTSVSVNCVDHHTNYDIGLDNGQNYSGGNRRMRGGPTFSDYVSYGLYADSGYSQAWGNTQGSNTYRTIAPGQITQSSQTFTIYGKLLSTPTVPGDYYDVVAVYVYY